MKNKIIMLALFLIPWTSCNTKKTVLPKIDIPDKDLVADIYELRRRIVPILDGFGIITLKNKSIPKQEEYEDLLKFVRNIREKKDTLGQLRSKDIIRLFGNPYKTENTRVGFIYYYVFDFGYICPLMMDSTYTETIILPKKISLQECNFLSFGFREDDNKLISIWLDFNQLGF